MRGLSVLCAASVATLNVVVAVQQEDIGYEKLWQDSVEDIDFQCWASAALPSWLNGSFILPSVAQFSYGGLQFEGVLDGFGKLHRFQLGAGQICFTARMMRTDFYNESRRLGTVPPAMLFLETQPPRKSCRWKPMCNVRGANGNTYVNTIKLGKEYSTWTDSPAANSLDPISLDVLGKYKWADSIGHKLHIGAVASAHPMYRQNGDLVALQMDSPMGPNLLGSYVNVVIISPEAPHTRKLLHTSEKLHCTPYMHSFGLTDDYVVLPYTPMCFSIAPTLINKPMIDSFNEDVQMVSHFRLIPFSGGDVRIFTTPRPFTYNHLVNSYQNESGVVFDVVAFQDHQLFLTQGAALVKVQLNKTARDSIRTSCQQMWRYFLHTDGPFAGNVTEELMSVPGRAVEFPKINMHFSGQHYCVYYAQEWFHNDREMGSMAILKHDLCKGTRKHWYNASVFPSEPFFVPRPGAKVEDDGVVVFSATDGTIGESTFVVLDGASMRPVVEQSLPVRITFTTHGEWFENLVGKPSKLADNDLATLQKTFVL